MIAVPYIDLQSLPVPEAVESRLQIQVIGEASFTVDYVRDNFLWGLYRENENLFNRSNIDDWWHY